MYLKVQVAVLNFSNDENAAILAFCLPCFQNYLGISKPNFNCIELFFKKSHAGSKSYEGASYPLPILYSRSLLVPIGSHVSHTRAG